MLDVHAGRVAIDGVDIADVGLSQLRRRITFVAQDVVLFSGTVRQNLDPLGEHDDATLWDALRRTGFSGTEDDDAQAGLDAHVAQGGTNLSRGQGQLLSLARAVATRSTRSRLVILDEATSSVDLATEERVSAVLQDAFAECGRWALPSPA
jgi:ABC-type multidrug transport system fused ATPase/permease subunit